MNPYTFKLEDNNIYTIYADNKDQAIEQIRSVVRHYECVEG